VAFGSFWMRIRTTAWKAKTAFHTYTQGPAAMNQQKEESFVRKSAKNQLA
jgi:hypothetical protein